MQKVHQRVPAHNYYSARIDEFADEKKNTNEKLLTVPQLSR